MEGINWLALGFAILIGAVLAGMASTLAWRRMTPAAPAAPLPGRRMWSALAGTGGFILGAIVTFTVITALGVGTPTIREATRYLQTTVAGVFTREDQPGKLYILKDGTYMEYTGPITTTDVVAQDDQPPAWFTRWLANQPAPVAVVVPPVTLPVTNTTSAPAPVDNPLPAVPPQTATLAADGSPPPPNPGDPVGLKYQPSGSGACSSVNNPMDYPACILQRVQAGELTGEQAVVMIQELGGRFGAPSFEDVRLTIPNRQPALCWCPGGITGEFPPDTAWPLSGTKGAKWKDLLFVIDAGTGGNDRVVVAAKDTKCWMVYRR